MPMIIKYPKFNFNSKRSLWIVSLHVFAILLFIFIGVSALSILLFLAIYLVLVFTWALNRSTKRRKRFERHINSFGHPFDKDNLDPEKVVVMAVPFEGSTSCVKLYWHEGEMVFGVMRTFRKLYNSEVEEVKEIETFKQPVIHIKLIDGSWDDEFYLPLDTTFRNK